MKTYHVNYPEQTATQAQMDMDDAPKLASALETLEEDDLYPGTFFRIPGIPVPGQTTWSLMP